MTASDPGHPDAPRAGSDGDAAGLDGWVTVLYGSLRDLAERAVRRERRDHTLQPTALVHEAYLRLNEDDGAVWTSRAHFLGIASRVLRRVLVDHARRTGAERRGAGRLRIRVEDAEVSAPESEVDLLALDEALSRLSDQHERPGRVIEMRFFCGMSMEEISDVLGVSTRTVTQDWAFGRAWLGRFLGSDE